METDLRETQEVFRMVIEEAEVLGQEYPLFMETGEQVQGDTIPRVKL